MVAVLKASEAECDRRVHQHAKDSEREADDHRPKRALRIQPFEKYTEEEDYENWRREISLHGLQVCIEPLRALNHRNPQ